MQEDACREKHVDGGIREEARPRPELFASEVGERDVSPPLARGIMSGIDNAELVNAFPDRCAIYGPDAFLLLHLRPVLAVRSHRFIPVSRIGSARVLRRRRKRVRW